MKKSKTNEEEKARVEKLIEDARANNSTSVLFPLEWRLMLLSMLVRLEKKHNVTLPLLEFKYTPNEYRNKFFPGLSTKHMPYHPRHEDLYEHLEKTILKKYKNKTMATKKRITGTKKDYALETQFKITIFWSPAEIESAYRNFTSTPVRTKVTKEEIREFIQELANQHLQEWIQGGGYYK